MTAQEIWDQYLEMAQWLDRRAKSIYERAFWMAVYTELYCTFGGDE